MTLLFITFGELAGGWNQLLFSEQSSLTLCVFRALTGMLVLTETRNWLSVYKLLLSPDGWFGYDEYITLQQPARFSLLNYMPPSTRSVEVLLGVQTIAGFCLTVGIQPQLAALICFITLVSIHNRNMYVLSSGDALYRFFCLFLVFAPTQTQLSVMDYPNLLQPEAKAPAWPLLMIQLFMANIYLKNVFFKLQGSSWLNGTATQLVLRVRIWNRFVIPPVLDRSWFYKTTTYGTLVIETALFTLIWIDECRLAVVALGVLFHLGLWVFLRIGFFQMAMIAGLGAFVSPHEYGYLFGQIQRWLA
ncbi:hypothetical protein GGR92_005125 [Spirosoma lacussanchae]|uniref:HTTM domain-containing protein n=1 Tax=Spirosoma lacussanchae TaxID=1884249 RepID=UPI001108DFC0|nr:HTTM domain-containing protein [Spirosoma lacussanchae]